MTVTAVPVVIQHVIKGHHYLIVIQKALSCFTFSFHALTSWASDTLSASLLDSLVRGRQGQRKAQSIKQEMCAAVWSYHATPGSALALICGGVVYVKVSMPGKSRINIYHMHSK